MPVAFPGLVRLRRHLFGRQADYGTAIAANRAYPFTGTPDPNLNWTDPEVDVGSLDIVVPPYRGAPDLSAGLNAPVVNYNDLPIKLAAMFGGGVTPTGGGTAKTWVFEPTSLTPDDIDVFTYEFGDDVEDDWFQFIDGLLESLVINGPRGLGPLTSDMTWRFGSIRYNGASESELQPAASIPTGGTTGLVADTNAAPVYLGDMELFIDSDADYIGMTKISNALHSFQLTISQDLDQKRFANGTGFDLAGYGRGARTIELQLDFAKTEDTVGPGSETDAWFSETSIERFVSLKATSAAVAEEGSPDTPFSWLLEMPMRYYTRAEDAEGGNSIVSLTGKAFYHDDFGHAFRSEVVNTLAGGDL